MTSEHPHVAVAVAVDTDFAMPLAVALHSVSHQLDASLRLDVYVVTTNLTLKSRKRLDRVEANTNATWTWIDGSSALPSQLEARPSAMRATYLRVALPLLLPSEIDRVIYLDADTLVRTSLGSLYFSDMGELPVLATFDYRIPYVSMPIGLANYQELGMAPDTPYCNSGVMLMNLEQWRSEKIGEQVYAYAIENQSSMNLNDQEALNAVLAGRWGALDPSWNQQTWIYSFEAWPESDFKAECQLRIDELQRSPRIVHFTGRYKPWLTSCGHYFRREWLDAVAQCGWFSPSEFRIWNAMLQSGRLAHRLQRKVERYFG